MIFRIFYTLIILGLFYIGCKSEYNNYDGNAYPTNVYDKNLSQYGYENQLVHMVFFPLKEDLTTEQKDSFLIKIETLKRISDVQGLSVGEFADLNDKRALAQYGVAVTMGFENKDNYHTYQNHPIHLELKSSVGKYLSAPPASFDFNARDK